MYRVESCRGPVSSGHWAWLWRTTRTTNNRAVKSSLWPPSFCHLNVNGVLCAQGYRASGTEDETAKIIAVVCRQTAHGLQIRDSSNAGEEVKAAVAAVAAVAAATPAVGKWRVIFEEDKSLELGRKCWGMNWWYLVCGAAVKLKARGKQLEEFLKPSSSVLC